MNDCEKISELLPEYVSDLLTREEYMWVASHIAGCKSCMKEAALLVRLCSEVQEESDQPGNICQSAFSKIYTPPGYKDAISYAFSTLKDALSVTISVTKFALNQTLEV